MTPATLALLAGYRATADPRLLALLDNARRAFDELAAYMAQRCAEAGVELPEEWRGLTSPDQP